MTPERLRGDHILGAKPRVDIHDTAAIPKTNQPSRANTPLRMPMQIHNEPTNNGGTDRERSHCGKEEAGVFNVKFVMNLH